MASTPEQAYIGLSPDWSCEFNFTFKPKNEKSKDFRVLLTNHRIIPNSHSRCEGNIELYELHMKLVINQKISTEQSWNITWSCDDFLVCLIPKQNQDT